eukprot:c30688_g1_i1.p1 GENE.c30688_g1_i1~~c30688_g1_i1.p1  ORF type:complete len:105 (+),score=26.43 c30688_g1_i1:18-332(+)
MKYKKKNNKKINSDLEVENYELYMPYRNILWIANTNSLWVLNGKDEVIFDLMFDYSRPTYTILEEVFGEMVSDIYYLDDVGLTWSPYPKYSPLEEDILVQHKHN